MAGKSAQVGILREIGTYVLNLRGSSPYWRLQAVAWGLIVVILIAAGGLFAFLGLCGVFGGGNLAYDAKGSPGPVTFRHYSHMWFENGKYKDCKTCHDKIFATQKYGTYAIRALRDSPPLKVRIGKDASTLFVPGSLRADQASMVTYDVTRACATCATGNCHDGKESFSRFDCLGCHRTR
jgi:hypothetical protein